MGQGSPVESIDELSKKTGDAMNMKMKSVTDLRHQSLSFDLGQ
jgi:hypothetical protein